MRLPSLRGSADPPPSQVRGAGWVATALTVIVFGALAVAGPDGGLVGRGPFTSDFFDEQAHALLDGRLDVDPDVAGLEGFEHDGRTYLYFGLVPALLRLPVAAVTDDLDGRLTVVSMLLGLVVVGWATTRLVWRARRWRRGDGPTGPAEVWAVGAFVLAVGLASPLLFLAARPVVYHETELWGTATTLVALEALLRWWAAPTTGRLVIASAAALVALNTRASVGGGAVAALALTAGLALLVDRVPWRRAIQLAAAVLLPVLAYAAVNQARFDHPFSVPFEDQVLSSFDPARQATLAATGGSLFGAEFAPTALVTYLRPDGIDLQRLFPWVTFREDREPIGDATFDTIDRSASLPVVAPSLTVLALVGALALLRRGWRDPWLASILGAASGLASTVTIAFIAHRYLADATPALVLAAALGAWVVADGLARSSRRVRIAAIAALGLLSVGGAVTSTALALQSQRLFILPSDGARRDFVAFQHDLHEGLGGERPPGVRRAEDAGAPGPRGEVVLLGDCRGAYWSDGRRWWPLELGQDDGIILEGPAGTGGTLATGAGWTVDVRVRGERAHLVYDGGGADVTGPWFAIGELDGPLMLWADRVNGELTVRRGDTPLLVAWFVDLDGPIRAGDGAVPEPAPTPLCDDLATRLDAAGQARPRAGSSS